MSINLLPNNLKNREKSELKKVKKAQKNNIQMYEPPANYSKKDSKKKKKIAARGASFFSFFSRKDNKIAKNENKDFLGKALNSELDKPKNDKNIEKLRINDKIKRKNKISETNGINSKIQKQTAQYLVKEVESSDDIVKKKFQSFQDYKKSKTEKQKDKNNSQRKRNNKIKLDDSSKIANKKKNKRKDSEVNFISGDLIGSIKIKIREKLFIMFISLGLSVIILFSLYILISWYQSSIINEINNIKNKIDETQDKINVYEERKDEIVKFQTRLNTIDHLIQNHIYSTNFLENLEKYTLPNVYYQDLNADVQGNVSISALTDSFASVAKQLIVFQQAKDFVESVEINSAMFSDSSEDKTLIVTFKINLKVKKDVFLK